jgi:hypothetical protein
MIGISICQRALQTVGAVLMISTEELRIIAPRLPKTLSDRAHHTAAEENPKGK